MKRLVVLLFAVAMISGAGASAQTSTPTKEPPAKLIVDPPLPDLLAKGIVWITWRVENVVIGAESGKDTLNASPRVGHLHIHVDDLPWLWADASNINTIDLAGMPAGPGRSAGSRGSAPASTRPQSARGAAAARGSGRRRRRA